MKTINEGRSYNGLYLSQGEGIKFPYFILIYKKWNKEVYKKLTLQNKHSLL